MNNETLTTIRGGTEVLVKYKDGSEESVLVRQLPVELMADYAAAIENDQKSVELYCDKQAGWALTLSPQSFNDVADLGLDLNSDFFSAWFRRRMRIVEALNPGSAGAIQRGLNAALEGVTEIAPAVSRSPATSFSSRSAAA